MATSVNSAWTLRRDTLIARALNLAGVLNAGHQPTADQKAVGTDLLQMNLTALQADGILLHAIERYTQALVAGDTFIVAPADTIDVEDGAVVTNVAGNDIELQLLTSRDYARLAVKATTIGQPVQYMPERNPDLSITIYFYPVPDSNWPTVTYPRVRKLRDSDGGNVDIDVPVKFLEAVTLKLASRFCRHYNRDVKAKALMEEYDDARDRAMNDETQRGPLRLTVDTGMGWWR
jgi:hypothetical protein